MKDNETLVEGRSSARAAELIQKAEAAGLGAQVVRTTSRGYIVPSAIFDAPAPKADKVGVPAEETETAENAPEAEEAHGEADEFNPSDHDVKEVRAYLATADAPEQERVLAAERNDKGRRSILSDYEENQT